MDNNDDSTHDNEGCEGVGEYSHNSIEFGTDGRNKIPVNPDNDDLSSISMTAFLQEGEQDGQENCQDDSEQHNGSVIENNQDRALVCDNCQRHQLDEENYVHPSGDEEIDKIYNDISIRSVAIYSGVFRRKFCNMKSSECLTNNDGLKECKLCCNCREYLMTDDIQNEAVEKVWPAFLWKYLCSESVVANQGKM